MRQTSQVAGRAKESRAAAASPDWLMRRIARMERAFTSLARRRILCIALAGLLSVVGRLLLLPVAPVPYASVHDETSYALAGATFASGRLTNPPHPMSVHFEPFHVLMHPTYMSVYPPGQGLVLAFGQVFMRRQYWGVLLSAAAMFAALAWMLYGWLPPGWAFFGAFLGVLQFGFLHYWTNSYWGGAVAATGGCLVLGAYPRIRKFLRARDSMFLGLGFATLAVSRPFEGFVLGVVVLAAMVRLLVLRTPAPSAILLRLIVPVSAILIPGLAFVLVENAAVTGHAFEFAHELYRRQVAVYPTFVWQHPMPIRHYPHQMLFEMFVNWEPSFEHGGQWGTLRGLLPALWGRLRFCLGTYIPHGFYAPIALVSFVALRFRRIRLLSVVIVAEFLAALLVNWSLPHYFAPVVGALLAMHVCFLRWLRAWRPHGRPVFAAVVCAIVSMFVLRTVERLHLLTLPTVGSTRAALEQKLDAIPGDHVVLVRYAPAHVVQDEYVFNGPNIDPQRVIWARAMASGQDEELKRYYSGRTFWLFEPDVGARLTRLGISGL